MLDFRNIVYFNSWNWGINVNFKQLNELCNALMELDLVYY